MPTSARGREARFTVGADAYIGPHLEVFDMARIDGRAADELRPVEIIPNINKFAEGS